MMLGEKMSVESREKLDELAVAILDLNAKGEVTDKRLSNFLDSVWEQIMEKEIGLPLTISIVRQAQDLTLDPDKRIASIVKYFEDGDEQDIMEGAFVEVSGEGDMLFLPPSEFESPAQPEVGPEHTPEEEVIPDYIN
jgi:hypothetical protein